MRLGIVKSKGLEALGISFDQRQVGSGAVARLLDLELCLPHTGVADGPPRVGRVCGLLGYVVVDFEVTKHPVMTVQTERGGGRERARLRSKLAAAGLPVH